MGASKGAQLYELSEWTETTGLASRAMVSSRKRRLESASLVATEKVSTGVGRPRQWLVLADDSFGNGRIIGLLRIAWDALSDRETR